MKKYKHTKVYQHVQQAPLTDGTVKKRFKMYKSKKRWVYSAALFLGTGAALATAGISQADEVTPATSAEPTTAAAPEVSEDQVTAHPEEVTTETATTQVDNTISSAEVTSPKTELAEAATPSVVEEQITTTVTPVDTTGAVIGNPITVTGNVGDAVTLPEIAGYTVQEGQNLSIPNVANSTLTAVYASTAPTATEQVDEIATETPVVTTPKSELSENSKQTNEVSENEQSISATNALENKKVEVNDSKTEDKMKAPDTRDVDSTSQANFPEADDAITTPDNDVAIQPNKDQKNPVEIKVAAPNIVNAIPSVQAGVITNTADEEITVTTSTTVYYNEYYSDDDASKPQEIDPAHVLQKEKVITKTYVIPANSSVDIEDVTLDVPEFTDYIPVFITDSADKHALFVINGKNYVFNADKETAGIKIDLNQSEKFSGSYDKNTDLLFNPIIDYVKNSLITTLVEYRDIATGNLLQSTDTVSPTEKYIVDTTNLDSISADNFARNIFLELKFKSSVDTVEDVTSLISPVTHSVDTSRITDDVYYQLLSDETKKLIKTQLESSDNDDSLEAIFSAIKNDIEAKYPGIALSDFIIEKIPSIKEEGSIQGIDYGLTIDQKLYDSQLGNSDMIKQLKNLHITPIATNADITSYAELVSSLVLGMTSPAIGGIDYLDMFTTPARYSTTAPAEIIRDGVTYKLVEVPNNHTANADLTNVVVYKYDAVIPSTVTTRYVDTNGMAISEEKIQTGDYLATTGSPNTYTTTSINIAGYALKETPKNTSGNFVAGNTVVTYICQADIKTPLTPVDENGKEIPNAPVVEVTGQPGDPIDMSKVPTVPGYEVTPGQTPVVPEKDGTPTNITYTPETPADVTTPLTPVDEAGVPIPNAPTTNVTGQPGDPIDMSKVPTVPGYEVTPGQTPVDENGKEIPNAPTTNVTGQPGDPIDMSKVPTVPGYEVTPGQTPVVPDKDGTLTNITYTPETPADVTTPLTPVDENGKEIPNAPTTNVTGQPGDPIDMSKVPTVPGYEVTPGQTPVIPDKDGTPTNITYTPETPADVTTPLTPVDEAGVPIPNAPTTNVTGQPGDPIDMSKVPTVPGYEVTPGQTPVIPDKDGTPTTITYTPVDNGGTSTVVVPKVEVTTPLIPVDENGVPIPNAPTKDLIGEPGAPSDVSDVPKVPGYTPMEGQNPVIPVKSGTPTPIKYVPIVSESTGTSTKINEVPNEQKASMIPSKTKLAATGDNLISPNADNSKAVVAASVESNKKLPDTGEKNAEGLAALGLVAVSIAGLGVVYVKKFEND